MLRKQRAVVRAARPRHARARGGWAGRQRCAHSQRHDTAVVAGRTGLRRRRSDSAAAGDAQPADECPRSGWRRPRERQDDPGARQFARKDSTVHVEVRDSGPGVGRTRGSRVRSVLHDQGHWHGHGSVDCALDRRSLTEGPFASRTTTRAERQWGSGCHSRWRRGYERGSRRPSSSIDDDASVRRSLARLLDDVRVPGRDLRQRPRVSRPRRVRRTGVLCSSTSGCRSCPGFDLFERLKSVGRADCR